MNIFRGKSGDMPSVTRYVLPLERVGRTSHPTGAFLDLFQSRYGLGSVHYNSYIKNI